MKSPVGLNIMIPMGVIGGIVILLLNGRSIRIDGFNAGANCLENGSQNPSLSPSHRRMCSDYIDEKILELNQFVNKFDQYEKKGVPVKALIQERKQKWINLKRKGLLPDLEQ